MYNVIFTLVASKDINKYGKDKKIFKLRKTKDEEEKKSLQKD
jgi:hypothetical protein